MHKSISSKFLEDHKLLDHLKENSYFIKELNRNPIFYKEFISQMKIIYKNRPSDKINNIIDNVQLFNTLLDTFK